MSPTPAPPSVAPATAAPLTAGQLAARLDALLNPVLSSRRTSAPLAAPLAPLAHAEQAFTLHWVEIVSRTNYEMAYQLAAAAPAALALLDEAAAEAWIIAAVDTYDREGLHPGTQVFHDYAHYAPQARHAAAVTFEQAAPVLKIFVRGLAGRPLTLEPAREAYTDSETLYLPLRIAVTRHARGNFLIYKIICTLLWAQTRYGTFNTDLAAAAQSHSDPARALAWLNYLESVRLDGRIRQALPGLARDLDALAGELGITRASNPRLAPLARPQATVGDSIALLDTLDLADEVPATPWQGVLHPAEANRVREARLEREKSELQTALAQLLDEHETSNTEAEFTLEIDAPSPDTAAEFKLQRDGVSIAPPDPMRRLLDSIVQDLGEVPPEWLVPDEAETAADEQGEEDGTAINDTTSARYYDEWDYQRGHYRKAWCALREVPLPPGDPAFVRDTLERYAPQVRQLKRTFELLRGEDRLLKRMPHGDDIDLDAVIAARADLRAGLELSERLHVKRHKTDRSLAVMFMVDMSGSTKGWVNEAERAALVLLAEALEVLGDRYAIYGFSGMTRKRCEIYPVKRFDEACTDAVRERIAGMVPQDYTRMGAAIRHLTALLAQTDARTRLLITLSDGKPDDYSDNYRGDYGIEDTRQALLEAHHAGIRPFCITIDHEARAYLPHMYGAAQWALVDDVSRLPLKVADIYRRITT